MHYGVTGGLSNRVNGQVAILDYLDDHYTARWAQTRKLSAASLCQSVLGIRFLGECFTLQPLAAYTLSLSW